MTAMEVLAAWHAAWPDALAAWSSWTLLRDPAFLDEPDLASHGMEGQIAAIRLADSLIMVNTAEVLRRGLQDLGHAVLAHEVGHHVYVPGNRTEHARLLLVLHRALAGVPVEAIHMVANLWADLLVNDRLQRRAGVDVSAIYRILCKDTDAGSSRVWMLYCRACEHLWRLPTGTLVHAALPAEMDGDAHLVAELVRTFAADPVRGGRRFATVLASWLAADINAGNPGGGLGAAGLQDTRGALGDGPAPDGLSGVDTSELEDRDDTLPADGLPAPARHDTATGQSRSPWEYASVLHVLGLSRGTEDDIARYYRERALPHLVPFPRQPAPRSTEPLAEGLAPWEPGDPLAELDLFSSVTFSPRPIPGVTTVQRVYGETPGTEPARVPVDLDIYVDCSGSMPDPRTQLSYLTLAATILTLSALRAGAAVQATLWSSAGLYETTRGFLRDEKRLLKVVTGFVSGGTSFPVHLLRDTYLKRPKEAPPSHVVVISDDGVDTMLLDHAGEDPSEKLCREALARARGGGTLVLNLPHHQVWAPAERLQAIGFRIHTVQDWADLVAFARAFARAAWGPSP